MINAYNSITYENFLYDLRVAGDRGVADAPRAAARGNRVTTVYSIDKLVGEARRLAADYRRATGKTLPVTAEIAVQDAIRLLGLTAAESPNCGYDAFRERDGRKERLQIKGRAIFDEGKGGHRLGQLKLEQPWDFIALVLMDDNYEPVEIHEADRAALIETLNDPSASKRTARGMISVSRFRMIGRLMWTREHGLEDDGYWDNQTSR